MYISITSQQKKKLCFFILGAFCRGVSLIAISHVVLQSWLLNVAEIFCCFDKCTIPIQSSALPSTPINMTFKSVICKDSLTRFFEDAHLVLRNPIFKKVFRKIVRFYINLSVLVVWHCSKGRYSLKLGFELCEIELHQCSSPIGAFFGIGKSTIKKKTISPFAKRFTLMLPLYNSLPLNQSVRYQVRHVFPNPSVSVLR